MHNRLIFFYSKRLWWSTYNGRGASDGRVTGVTDNGRPIANSKVVVVVQDNDGVVVPPKGLP